MILNKSLVIKQTGETIVEVLISLAILSSAMGIAFATASRSTKAQQANKERYQALLVANEQSNLLKVVADGTQASTIRIGSGVFCITTGYQVATGANYDTNCKNQGPNEPRVYDITIKSLNASCAVASKICSYNIHVEWDSVKGGRDSLEVYYAT